MDSIDLINSAQDAPSHAVCLLISELTSILSARAGSVIVKLPARSGGKTLRQHMMCWSNSEICNVIDNLTGILKERSTGWEHRQRIAEINDMIFDKLAQSGCRS